MLLIMTALSEFDNHCTFLVHRSHHHYITAASNSVTASLANAAGIADKLGGETGSGAPHCPQQPNLADLQKRLENSRDDVKLQALKEVVLWGIHHPGSGAEISGIMGGSSGAPASNNVASRLLVTIIRYVLPSTDHKVKKMLQLYWETVDKTNADGSLREEMILVCNKLRQDLLHPNEYIRGSTLRLLCKMRYIKILEPLVESILQNLSHAHPYVRRNAIMCVFSTVRSFGSDILPNATTEIYRLLLVENDISAKRNAFLMLIHCDLDRAVEYILSVHDKLSYLGDLVQLAVLELLRRVVNEQPSHTATLLRMILTLVNPYSSPTVAYEGASTLLLLTLSPVALKAATRAYIGLLSRQADNNVKLIVLDRLNVILQRYPGALEEVVIDILRAVASPSLAVRKKALAIGLQLVNTRTVADVVTVLKKELVKTLTAEQQKTDAASVTSYQQLLIQATRIACKGYLDVVQPMLNLLLEFLTDRNLVTASEVSLFVRELIALYPELRPTLLQKLADALPDVPHASVARICLWILGEFSTELNQRKEFLNTVYEALRPLPFPESSSKEPDACSRTPASSSVLVQTDQSSDVVGTAADRKVKVTTRTVILPDGTYGTEDVYEVVDQDTAPANDVSTEQLSKSSSKLRSHLLSGDFLLASVIAVTVTKLTVKPFDASLDLDYHISQDDHARSLLIVGSLLKYCSTHPCCSATSGASIRITQALRILTQMPSTPAAVNLEELWFPHSRVALLDVLELEKEAVMYESTDFRLNGSLASASSKENAPEPPDSLVRFRQLGAEEDSLASSDPEKPQLQDHETDLKIALGLGPHKEDTSVFQQRLAKVQQMTGLSDPVYVEAFLQLNQFDFIVELLVINRTNETLQNVTVELSTHGDLKIVDRPFPVNLSAGQSRTLYASIRVQSTETGVIFGHIIYDKSTSVDKEYLVLNELQVDLLDFIQQSWIGELSFRSMWAEFEWENKITISTRMTDVSQFIEHIMRQTNMTVVGKYTATAPAADCVDPVTSESQPLHDGDAGQYEALPYPPEVWNTTTAPVHTVRRVNGISNCASKVKELPALSRLMSNSSFFAVNLYSKSIFGEDALANVSIEKLPNGKLAGSIRIRSRTQGIALSLGDRITIAQREIPL